jgi:hypothetical protein
MKKIAIMAAFAFSSLFAQANVVLSMVEGYLYKNDGTTVLPENSTIVLLCDANNNGFGDLTQATTSWTADSNDVILGRWAFNYNLDTGIGSDVITYDLAGTVGTGDNLMLVWYDKAYSAGDAGPGQGVHFGTFRTDSAISFSDIAWTTPTDGGWNLNFATVAATGDSPESAGVASFQTVPEPATAMLALIGGGMAYALRRNKRQSIYIG